MKDIVSAAIFLVLSFAFGVSAVTLPMGSLVRIGPGVFPLLLAGLLALLGAAILISGIRQPRGEARLQANWRAIALVVGSVVGFGAVLVPLGFVPAVALAAGVSAMATRENRPLSAAMIGIVIVAFCWLVFMKGLGLSAPAFGTLFKTG